MAIFGARDSFGRSRFGQANYGELSLSRLLPAIHRSLDDDSGQPIQKMLRAFEAEMEDLRRQIDLLPYQRDPYLATGLDHPNELEIIDASNVADGVELTVDIDHLMSGVDQVDILGAVGDSLAGRYSLVRITGERSFVISTPALLNTASVIGAKCMQVTSSAALVEVSAIEVYNEPWGDNEKTLTRLTLTPQSRVDSIGVGYFGIIKAFLPVPPPENAFEEPSRALYRVLYIRRRDQELGASVDVVCEGGLRLEDIEGDLPNRLVMRFIRQSSLTLLANDYGLVTDENLPDAFQRSEIANVYQFLRLKSSRLAYEARSQGGGFTVRVSQLYKLCGSDSGVIPEKNVFLGTTGAGNTAYYSDIPRLVHPVVGFHPSAALDDGSPLFFTDGVSTALNTDAESYLACIFQVDIVKITRIDDPLIYESQGYQAPYFVVDLETPNYPATGWQITDVSSGDFALIDGDGNAYYIRETADDGPFTASTTVHIDAVNLLFNEGDRLCVSYRPSTIETDCCLCPSSEIKIEIEALPAFINQSGYSGAALAEAYRRMLSRIRREQVPVHVHVAIATLVVSIDVVVFAVEPSVTLSIEQEVADIVIEFNQVADADARFDDIPADVQDLDTGTSLGYPSVSVTIVEG